MLKAFQSTPSAWRETLRIPLLSCRNCISIHSLRMEGDILGTTGVSAHSKISIHSLRMEGDYRQCLLLAISTYFNPLPPHGGRRFLFSSVTEALTISIHSLRMEGDSNIETSVSNMLDFNPLPPHGGRRRFVNIS